MNENQVRERMAKLIVDTPSIIVSKNCTDDALLVLVAVDIADHLIANGVTIREWIPVTERLPDMQDEVLTYSECNGVRAGSVIVEGEGNEETIWYLCRTGKISIDVTHWMPLPEPPESEKGGESDA